MFIIKVHNLLLFLHGIRVAFSSAAHLRVTNARLECLRTNVSDEPTYGHFVSAHLTLNAYLSSRMGRGGNRILLQMKHNPHHHVQVVTIKIPAVPNVFLAVGCLREQEEEEECYLNSHFFSSTEVE